MEKRTKDELPALLRASGDSLYGDCIAAFCVIPAFSSVAQDIFVSIDMPGTDDVAELRRYFKNNNEVYHDLFRRLYARIEKIPGEMAFLKLYQFINGNEVLVDTGTVNIITMFILCSEQLDFIDMGKIVFSKAHGTNIWTTESAKKIENLVHSIANNNNYDPKSVSKDLIGAELTKFKELLDKELLAKELLAKELLEKELLTKETTINHHMVAPPDVCV